MDINIQKLKAVAAKAKAKITDKRWIAAIEKAVAGVESGWIVTELADGIMVTTENGTYRANGVCQCKAFEFGQACKHRALARLIELYNESEPVATNSDKGATGRYCGDRDLQHLDACKPHITRSVERDVVTRRRVKVVRCDNWII